MMISMISDKDKVIAMNQPGQPAGGSNAQDGSAFNMPSNVNQMLPPYPSMITQIPPSMLAQLANNPFVFLQGLQGLGGLHGLHGLMPGNSGVSAAQMPMFFMPQIPTQYSNISEIASSQDGKQSLEEQLRRLDEEQEQIKARLERMKAENKVKENKIVKPRVIEATPPNDNQKRLQRDRSRSRSSRRDNNRDGRSRDIRSIDIRSRDIRSQSRDRDRRHHDRDRSRSRIDADLDHVLLISILIEIMDGIAQM